MIDIKNEETLIENDIKCYRDYICHCKDKDGNSCELHIPYPTTKSGLNNHKYKGIPKIIHGHGHTSGMTGRHHTEETIKRMIENRPDMHGENGPMFGKHHTEETIEKMKKSRKKYLQEHPEEIKNMSKRMSGKNNHMYGKPAPEGSGYKGNRCYYWNAVQGDVCFRSSYELAYAKYLDRKHISWVYERKAFSLSNGTTYRPDFYLLKKQKYIEIKGYITQMAYTKIKLFIDEYPNINYKILCKDDLIRKGII